MKNTYWIAALFLSSITFGTPEYGDPNGGFPDCSVDRTRIKDTFEYQIKSGLTLPKHLNTILTRVAWYGYHSVDSFDKPICLIFQEDGTLLLRNWRYKLPPELRGTYQIENDRIYMRFEKPIRVGDGLGYLEYPTEFVGGVSEKGALTAKVRYPQSPDRTLELMTFTDTLYKCH